MRLKVGDTRIAVSRVVNTQEPDSTIGAQDKRRGMMYASQPLNGEMKVEDYTTEQLKQRIEESNNSYHVFFNANRVSVLKEHFKRLIMCLGKIRLKNKDNIKEQIISALTEYKGYIFAGESFQNVDDFEYKIPDKNMSYVMKKFVYEYMNNKFYTSDVLVVTISILCCICDKKGFGENIGDSLKGVNEEKIVAFYKACQECKYKPFVDGTWKLEQCFDALVCSIIYLCKRKDRELYLCEDKEKIQEVLNKQLNKIKSYSYLKLKNKIFQLLPNKEGVFKYEYADEERLNAIIIRMRRGLKKGTNTQIVKELLQALASGNFSENIAAIENNKKKELLHFIDSVNKDYYRFSLVKSVKNMDVRAQVYKDYPVKIDEDGTDDKINENSKDVLYKLSISNREKNAGLIKTMERYSKSKDDSDNVLIELKQLLYEYFVPGYNGKFTIKDIWKYPKGVNGYFDENFICIEDESKPESITNILSMWEAVDKEKKFINQRMLKKRIEYVNVGKYLECSKKNEKMIEDDWLVRKYWLSFIEEYIEKKYVNTKKTLKKEDCNASNMMLACWKAIVRTLCGKYIDLGKMVYHIAMPEDMTIRSQKDGGSYYGQVQKSYEAGVSSFIYEDISAEDNLQRSIVDAVMSASNNLARAVFSDKVDDCMYPEKGIILKKQLKGNALTSILRFYGGESTFGFDKEVSKDIIESVDKEEMNVKTKEDSKGNNKKPDAWKLINEQILLIKQIRDENYHYTPGLHKEVERDEAIRLLNHDVELYKQLVVKKYYTNNIADFYDKNMITELVQKLYDHTEVGEAQIPAFKNIWSRADLSADYVQICGSLEHDPTKTEQQTTDNNITEKKLFDAMYFMLKEIYYRDFILDKNKRAFSYFTSSVSKLNDKLHPEKAFKEYVEKHKEEYNTFGLMCQKIMNQYNAQNSNRDEKKYENFKALIHKCTKEAFIEYLKCERVKDVGTDSEKKYGWIFTSITSDKSKKESNDKMTYLNNNMKNIAIPKYLKIIKESHQNTDNSTQKNVSLSNINVSYIMGWYTLGHYIHPKQLNTLIGEFKNYIQFKNDIEKRANIAGQPFDSIEKLRKVKQISKAKEIICILDFVRGATRGISGKISDYYAKDDTYAEYLYNYIDFPIDKKQKESIYYNSFNQFCKNGEMDFDIYLDKVNPKLLHNVEFARMYAGGELSLIKDNEVAKSNNMADINYSYKITGEEITTCLKDAEYIAKIQSKGRCENEEEQKKIVDYQQLKRRITLNDVTNIYQIVSELLGKLISLSYLRERDQMYLLLGFYYMLLQNESEQMGTKWTYCIKEGNEYKEVKEGEFNTGTFSKDNDDKKVSSGLVLYQIVSLFDYGIEFVSCSNGTLKLHGNYNTSEKLKEFYPNHISSYNCAIRLFHDDHKHDRYINCNIRNYVDHSKYYKKTADCSQSKSIMELYSEYYTKCFGYSTRLKQSVIENLKNILESEHVLCDLEFVTTYVNDKEKTQKVEIVFKNRLKSTNYKYKLSDNSFRQLPANSDKFLEMLKAVLESK